MLEYICRGKAWGKIRTPAVRSSKLEAPSAPHHKQSDSCALLLGVDDLSAQGNETTSGLKAPHHICFETRTPFPPSPRLLYRPTIFSPLFHSDLISLFPSFFLCFTFYVFVSLFHIICASCLSYIYPVR